MGIEESYGQERGSIRPESVCRVGRQQPRKDAQSPARLERPAFPIGGAGPAPAGAVSAEVIEAWVFGAQREERLRRGIQAGDGVLQKIDSAPMAEEEETGAPFTGLSVIGGVAAETLADEKSDRVHGAP